MNEFFINNFHVDTNRCSLSRNGNTVSLEPKVIQVLQTLALHQGQVVSHQTLLAAVWPNTVVEPSTLQRCIAQLRKAFDDDARQQRIIATYPKKGYSLLAKVSMEKSEQAVSAFRRLLPGAALAASLMLGAFLILGNPFLEDGKALEISENTFELPLQPVKPALDPAMPVPGAGLSSVDDFPVYSPDGRFVVYPRYLEENNAHLWARDLAYGNDFLLTEEVGNYQHLAWSKDGSQLVFIDSTCGVENCGSGQCTSLKSVSMSQSETNGLSVRTLINCSEELLLAPEWLNNREIAVIEVNGGLASLMRYDLKTLAKSSLYQSDEVIPYKLSYSRQTNILTISAMNPSGRKELLFLDISNGYINRNDTATFNPDVTWYPSSAPR